MGRASRQKGARGEREVRDILLAAGVGARRDGRLDDDLVHGLDGFHLEVKRRESYAVGEWIAQAEMDARGRIPVVVFRKSNQPWRAILDFSTLVQLILNQKESDVVPYTSGTDQGGSGGLAVRERNEVSGPSGGNELPGTDPSG